jgi:fibronectin type 3 domain-containing protein
MVYNDSAVTLGQTYYYVVSAENDYGVGSNSSEAHSLYALAPAAPENLMAIGSVGTVSLSWSAPTQNGAAISGYTIRTWTYGSLASVAAQIGSSSTSSTLSGLTNGVQYWFSVSAINSAGAGPTSDSTTCTIGSVPSSPTALGTAAGNGYVSITWGVPASNGGISALSYHVWRSTSGTSTLIADLGTTVRSYSDTSVVPGTMYYYTVTASNVIGVGAAVGPSSVVAATLPGAPITVTANDNTTSVLVSWTSPTSNGGNSLTGYKVYRTDGTGWTLLSSVTDPTVLCYCDQSVVAGVSYQYCVSALNSIGEGSRSNASASITIVSPPSAFSMAALVGNSIVTLKWVAPISDNTPLLGYTIIRTETGTGSVSSTTVDPSLTRFIDTNVTAGLN